MKELLKVFLIIVSIFATTFLVIKFTGILTIEQIEEWLKLAKSTSTLYVGLTVIALLFADLFIAVPTLTIIILSGYFLGFLLGAFFSIMGVMLAGIVGYLLSRQYGEKVLRFLIKDDIKRMNAIETFHKHGFVTILLSRAMPMIPEASACLSGMTKMPFLKFLSAWVLSSVPYALIAAYAGSISTLDNPKPAIFVALGLSAFFWTSWYFYHKKQRF